MPDSKREIKVGKSYRVHHYGKIHIRHILIDGEYEMAIFRSWSRRKSVWQYDCKYLSTVEIMVMKFEDG